MSKYISRELKAWGQNLILEELSDLDLSIMKLGKTTNRHGVLNIEFRVKSPITNADDQLSLLKELKERLGIILTEKELTKNKLSPNSGRYSSIAFKKDGELVDLVVATGANRGETFEKQLLQDLQKFHMEGISTGMVDDLLLQLEKVDDTFKIGDIKRISGGAGGRRYRAHLPPEDHGPIIADIIIETTDGEERYLSVKNPRGNTLANLGGTRAAFHDDTFALRKSQQLTRLLTDLGVNLTWLSQGLRAYRDDKVVPFNAKIATNNQVDPRSNAWKFFVRAWGYNYFYVRQVGDGFKIFHVNKDGLSSSLLKNLRVDLIYYPSKDSKQLSVHLSSDGADYKLEVRNPHGPGQIIPTDTKLVIKRLKV